MSSLSNVSKHGYFWRKDLIARYREELVKEGRSDTELKSMRDYFDSYLTKNFKRSSDYSLYKTTNGSLVVFENQKHTEFSLVHILSLLEENTTMRNKVENQGKSIEQENEIKKMFDEQTKLFGDNSSTLDYRKLINEENVLLGDYIHKPLFDFFERVLNISKTTNYSNDSEEEVETRRKKSQYFRILMAVGILCNLKNRKSLVVQTIIGLSMFAGGLKDNGYRILNHFGLSCSIKHIRRMAKSWSSVRKCIDEINHKHMWRITFDNLNFNRKFAKTSALGGDKSGRMLDLLTGQVSHSANEPLQPFFPGEATEIPLEDTQQFRIDERLEESSSYNSYLTNLTTCQIQRNEVDNHTTILLKDLEHKMPDFTPPTKDIIAYATVKEAKSSSIHDIACYLQDLKTDLKIGEEGYPSKVVLGGDQQTYSLLKNLMKKYPDTFNWIIPMIGDWHLLKLASECIKSIIWNGGLHHIGIECGHLKDVHQWRDIHNLLIGLHESLISNAINSHSENLEEFDLSSFIQSTTAQTNTDQISSFWAKILHYLNVYVGYYFAIRSGNFTLRNACLPKLAELFFAYNHGNYQTLVCEHIADLHNLPDSVKNEFLRGRWTMSVAGHKYQNIALDEGHESVINKRLKMLTSRASEHRTVTLSNFMAYLDKFTENLQKEIYTKNSKRNKSKTGTAYLKKISPCIKKAMIFPPKPNRRLCNIFAGDKAVHLDDGTVSDLLTFEAEGKKRMCNHVKATYIDAIKTKPPRDRKFATFTPKQVTQFKEKQKTNKVTLLLKRAYAELQKAGHYIEKTVAFPLALCNEEGRMRDRNKSKILNEWKKNVTFSSMFLTNLPFDITSAEVIIDFLKFLHEPTPPNVKSYHQLAEYYWKHVIMKLGFDRGATFVSVVIDKAQFVPPIRQIVHDERKGKGKGKDISKDVPEGDIGDELPCVNGKVHTQSLKNQDYKLNLITYLREKFIVMACERLKGETLLLDCLEDTPLEIKNGNVSPNTDRINTKGEADIAIFIHARNSECDNIVIAASDTDIPIYALAFLEKQGCVKNITVEREMDEDYISVNKALENFRCHPNISNSTFVDSIGHTVLSLYLLAAQTILAISMESHVMS